MAGFMKNIQMAWLGWKNYTDDGKMAALLLVSLAYLWYCGKRMRGRSFWGYSMCVTIGCICPITAALFMRIQTKFYDYEWIWSMVPVTAVIALGMTLFLARCWGDFGLSQWRKGLPAAMFLLAVTVLAGGMGGELPNQIYQVQEREKAYGVLEELIALSQGGDVCLWAPREVMEYAREADGHIRLPYGRNMWDASLNAYAYDTYGEDILALYEWMEQMSDPAAMETALKSLETCVRNARNMGVDCIMLPESVASETIQRMEKASNLHVRCLEGYWVFYG